LTVDELFHAALAVNRSERARVFYERAGTDVELVAKVEGTVRAPARERLHPRARDALSTFAADVDTASHSNVRRQVADAEALTALRRRHAR
jgi:hypothetical protein